VFSLHKALLLLTFLAALGLAGHARADGKVNVLVLRENGGGSAARAQPHLDALITRAASINHWSSAAGKYVTRAAAAEKYIANSRPKFGMFTLPAFLRMRSAHGLHALGTVEVIGLGGQRYHVVAKKNGAAVGACKTLSSNHAHDPRFIDRVVGRGSFKLADFTVKARRRPIQPIKDVIRNESDCALLDDAQVAELTHIEGGSALHSIWRSAELPSMAVLAFSGTSAPERAKFQSTLGSVCKDGGKSACDKVGISALRPVSKAHYQQVIALYGD